MSKLTEQQLSIIHVLESEFIKLNEVPPKANGLIDVNSIIHTANAENNFEREIQLANQAFVKLKKEQILIDAESLKGDLGALGLKIYFSKNHSMGFYIVPNRVETEQELYQDYSILVNYIDTHYTERTFNSIKRRVDSQFGVKFNRETYGHYYFTFKDAIASNDFQEKMIYLYKKSLEPKPR